MIVFVCVGEQGSILFNRRRVSSDLEIIKDILGYIGCEKLYMREYSTKIFPKDARICVSTDCLNTAGNSDAIFWEEPWQEALLQKADKVVVYHFNRLYPADVKLPIDQLRKCLKQESVVEFKGNSHEQITREVYVL